MNARPLLVAVWFTLPALAPALAGAGPASGISRAYMDTTCSPCRDFYRYANGRWIDSHEIPAAYTGIGTGREMIDRNQDVLRGVLDRSAANVDAEGDPTLAKLGHLYAVLMDSARASREGVGALSVELRFIDAIKDARDLPGAFGRYALLGSNRFAASLAPFRLVAEVDPKHSSMVIAQIFQSGLGLPDRDYYFRADPKSVTQRAAYTDAVAKLLALTGTPAEQAGREANAVLRLETALAESSLTRVQMRDPLRLYHPLSVRELSALAPAIDWGRFFTALGLPALAAPDARVDVSMPGFVRQLNALVASTPIETWRAYLKSGLLRRYGAWLGDDAFQVTFRLQSALTGQSEPLPLWRRATEAVDNAMGEALGKAYVAEAFPPAAKQRATELVVNLRAAFAERIQSRSWLSVATREQALKKLDAIMQKIGYPDTWRDYSSLSIDPRAPAVASLMTAQRFEAARQISKIGRAPDRAEWRMTPPTVNAYYEPTTNEIVFPAGILQPPRFDPQVDDAANYGSIGSVIGHELSHGFDDEGRKYDGAGNLRDWWTDADGKTFEALAAKVVEQYDGYIGVDTLHVNGRLTLGENLGDLGGVVVAYHAWQRSLGGRPAPVIDGLTGDQRFFIAFAQSWRTKSRDDAIRQRVLTDPHSPPMWRVNGPVSNMDEFRKAFGCTSGDPMVREGERQIVIW